jgi:hypothetical protein
VARRRDSPTTRNSPKLSTASRPEPNRGAVDSVEPVTLDGHPGSATSPAEPSRPPGKLDRGVPSSATGRLLPAKLLIGGGAVVLILIIVVIVLLLRR